MRVMLDGKQIGSGGSIQVQSDNGEWKPLDAPAAFGPPPSSMRQSISFEMDGASHITLLHLWAALLDR